ncbi:hypothetical protein EVB81_007 [Rhizobium phage RHph_I46]|uniref:Uncharacterized protein n=1 Tax=Rhizobium phage RHph_I1_9 TaxID=2509729 RepID=A0A7S5RII5_9CAUD|nr:hypothetical protein PP936_gp007 [Rhizobium phage RHph_I1_9]QIG69576.1 hypothetical protein EVB81_007 [Rhizobium phage RHph_I46]QIG70857.1 hypothetical protein EVB92_007 [Rhizobium phage RHph_I9]QIG73444.1 hypothetical protein EVC04_007 [Rhizobium phage RHph_I1_9]QIG76196.1 hypothetical protein EVC25_007 [Rhizobium phage RHph_I34]
MSLYIKQSGVWTPVPTLKIKNAGSWSQVQVGYVKVSGVWRQFYVPEVLVTITANTLNVNIQSLFTSGVWTNPAVAKRVVINSGVIVGSSVPATAALRTGTGWAGTLTLENKGEIQGAGGVANSGAGGHAILCEAAGMIIKNTGAIRGGGGGGGKGGNGGAGYYTSTVSEGPIYQGYPASSTNRYYWDTTNGTSIDAVYWNDANVISGNVNSPYTVGAYTYTRGVQRASYTAGSTTHNVFEVSRSYQTTTNTSGGIGGNGGRGQGYGQTNASGSAGTAGGTNAGAGGTGGTGANFGAAGATGNSGANGNNGSGTAGTAGGAAGKAISGSSSLTNTGTIQGATS